MPASWLTLRPLPREDLVKAIEEFGQRRHPNGPLIFAARLVDGTYLPCVGAEFSERHVKRVSPPDREPYLQFDPVSLGQTAYSSCIIQPDKIAAVEPAPYFLPQWLYEHLLATDYRGECLALRVQMKDGASFTLVGGFGVDCYRPPEGYTWSDVAETGAGYDHKPEVIIGGMVMFRCFVSGLSGAQVKAVPAGEN